MSSTTATRSVSLDTVFRILSDPTRRRILTDLSDRGPTDADWVAVESLIPDDADEERRPELRTKLLHVHLPTLTGEEFVIWDRENDAVRRGPKFGEITPVLGLLRDNEAHLPDGWP